MDAEASLAAVGHATRAVVPEHEAAALLADYGVAYPKHSFAKTADDAVEAAAHIGYPVVVKVVSPDIVHKTDAGGVVTGVHTPVAVRAAVTAIRASVAERMPSASVTGFLVAREVPHGLEVIVGGLRDGTFGPAVMVGMGGIYAEVLADAVFRVAPLKAADAAEMLRELHAFPLLAGARGGDAADLDCLAETLAAVSRLMTDREDIAELDLNPVRVSAAGAEALDARIILR
jgi:acetate---CoA ligase (ADP-forming) subunit beta